MLRMGAGFHPTGVPAGPEHSWKDDPRMASPDFDLQMCPTRLDGHRVLFAHKVTPVQCQDRQRGHYHKCWTCAHNNALSKSNGALVRKPVAAPTPAAAADPAKREMRVG